MDGDKIKNFFIFHVEKMILVGVIAVSGFMVYQGLQQENILEKHQPDRLISDANQVRAEVDEDHNDEILPPRIPDFNIENEIERRRTAVNPDPYGTEIWRPLNIASTIRRQDPELLAPLALQMHSMLASIAVRSSTEEWPLKDLEPAEAIEKKAEPVKRESRKRGFQRGAGSGEDSEMMDMFDEYEEDTMDEESMEDMYSGGVSAGGKRKLDRKDDLGFRPSNTKHLRTGKTQYPVPGAGWFIAGSAVVPNSMLHESFKKALGEADNYDPVKRDFPIFLDFTVQRADVTNKSVDQLQESDWVDRNDLRKTAFEAATYWAGFAPDMIPKDYRDEKLSTWLPPVLLDDYSKLALHPLVPLIPWRDVLLERGKEAEDEDPDEPLSLEEFEFGVGGNRFEGGPDEFEMDDEFAPAGAATGRVKNPPEYKLIRFYDFYKDPKRDANTPLPGRKYVYRVRYAVEDPNFPSNPMLQPKGSTLDSTAYERFNKLVTRALEENKRDSKRWSQWSSPSETVSLPGFERVYVGPVKASEPRAHKVGNRVVQYSAERPKASVVVSRFNTTYRTWSPMLIEEITRGTVLSKEAEAADIVDPITLEVKKLENPKFVSRTTVIDIAGGAPLGIQEGEGMVEPGIMLLFDENGELRVHDEIDDLESFRIQSFANERGE